MLAQATNRSRSPRGLHTARDGIVLLEPGRTMLLDLADHPLHRAWEAAGEVRIAPLSDKEARAARKRIEAEAEAAEQARAAALAGLAVRSAPTLP